MGARSGTQRAATSAYTGAPQSGPQSSPHRKEPQMPVNTKAIGKTIRARALCGGPREDQGVRTRCR